MNDEAATGESNQASRDGVAAMAILALTVVFIVVVVIALV